MRSNEQDLILGVDLGTSHSLVFGWPRAGNRPEAYVLGQDSPLLRSALYFDPEQDQWCFGQQALQLALRSPERAFLSSKCHMGDRDWRARVEDREFTAAELSGKLLDHLRQKVEGFPFGRGPVPSSQAAQLVICHPFHYLEHAEAMEDLRSATASAFAQLPSRKCDFLAEPTSAALSYLSRHRLEDGEVILVFDLGGGTFDITVLRVEIFQEELNFRVLALGGAAKLGGDAMDRQIYGYLKRLVLKHFPNDAYLLASAPDLDEARRLVSRRFQLHLREEASRLKVSLEADRKHKMEIRVPPPPRPRLFGPVVTRRDLNRCLSPILAEIEACVVAALEAIEGKVGVDTVVLVGGATRMPAVQKLVQRLLGKVPYTSPQPAWEVARGAALYSALRARALGTLGHRRVGHLTLERPPLARLDCRLGIAARLADERVFWPLDLDRVGPSATQCRIGLRGEGEHVEITLLGAPLEANPNQLLGLAEGQWAQYGIRKIASGEIPDFLKWIDDQGEVEIAFRLVAATDPRVAVHPVGDRNAGKVILDIERSQ